MTIKGPKGRMTKALVTMYDVGDVVKLVRRQPSARAPRVGDVGTVRRVVISDANDGDATFLMFYVQFPRQDRATFLHEDDFSLVTKNETRLVPAIAPEDAEWLRWQLDALDAK